eukprot:CAMPEP_0198328280 /NCGR_PEP_ID=MMETSP1450-20131203/15354_1 /TAXON_ID=753684 ORGANISM="Madagascaria erythrocladiodes, Strain CCMP3234" /NCGR_SAMPLE_ID=MMETSP1450 /ASSEMBLY_ACC=CAM_ASM_001115 /LENGTH=243 /DNA_ID=CAMNT_0044032403 /DNA_START=80 /DNA_END=808 /DNA_ORIENTATION=-
MTSAMGTLRGIMDYFNPQFDPRKLAVLLGACGTRLKIHHAKKREAVRAHRAQIRAYVASGEIELARNHAANAIRDELLAETYGVLQLLSARAKERLSVVRLSDTCPPELDEAFSTLVFASTRCTDITELRDITNQLMLKYGEEWGRAAHADRNSACNPKVVRKLTIFADDTLVRQYILDVCPDYQWEDEPDDADAYGAGAAPAASATPTSSTGAAAAAVPLDADLQRIRDSVEEGHSSTRSAR